MIIITAIIAFNAFNSIRVVCLHIIAYFVHKVLHSFLFLVALCAHIVIHISLIQIKLTVKSFHCPHSLTVAVDRIHDCDKLNAVRIVIRVADLNECDLVCK